MKLKNLAVWSGILLSAASHAQIAQSTFDWDLNEWRGDTCQGGFHWLQTGGFPDGHMQWKEPCGSTWALAPESFLGDWQGITGRGILSFDYKIAVRPSDGEARDYEVVLLGADGGVLRWNRPSPDRVTDWTHFEIPIVSSSFTEVVGTYAGVMNHVMSLRIRIRMFTNTLPEEDNRIDNVILAVPEPGSFLAFAGLCFLLVKGGRNRKG